MSNLDYKYIYEIVFVSPSGEVRHTVECIPPYAVGQHVSLATLYENGEHIITENEIKKITHLTGSRKTPGSNEVVTAICVVLTLEEIK